MNSDYSVEGFTVEDLGRDSCAFTSHWEYAPVTNDIYGNPESFIGPYGQSFNLYTEEQLDKSDLEFRKTYSRFALPERFPIEFLTVEQKYETILMEEVSPNEFQIVDGYFNTC
jgi:hypothetical protein